MADIILVKESQRGIPDNKMILTKGQIVPFSLGEVPFILEVDQLGVPVIITIYHVGDKHPGVPAEIDKSEITVVPQNLTQTVNIRLGKGLNFVEAFNTVSGKTFRTIISATHYASILQGYARELFNNVQVLHDEQIQAIFSTFATRLAEPLLPLQQILPDVQSLQIFGLRMIVRALTTNAGQHLGVQDYITGLVQSTPLFIKTESVLDFEPNVHTIYLSQEDFSGNEAHVWIPNSAITTWLAFTKLANNVSSLYQLLEVSETEVVVNYQGLVQRHVFDFESELASFLLADAELVCFDNIRVLLEFISVFTITVCAASYTWDLFVMESAPLGDCRVTLDAGLEFDIGCTWDVDPLDPLWDGLVGLSLVGRMEQDVDDTDLAELCFDTFCQPAVVFPGPRCCYPNGYYTQNITLNNLELEVDATGYLASGFPYLGTGAIVLNEDFSAPEFDPPLNPVLFEEDFN